VCTDGTGALVCSVALSGQAPKPHSGAPQARGLTANAPTEQSSVLPRGRHALRADEPVAVGGGDAGPGPYELLLMALGSCTSMTVNMYAARKNWTLDQVVVRLRHDRVHADDCANCEDPKSMIDRILCSIELVGPLDEAQRKQLIEIAKKCPVHRTLTNKIEVRTDLVAS
jgi:putative redox protein